MATFMGRNEGRHAQSSVTKRVVPQRGVLNEGLPHLACAVVLDTSGSMGPCVDDLRQALLSFKESLESNIDTRTKVEVCIITFNSQVHLLEPFGPVSALEIPPFEADGLTSMYGAVDRAMQEIDERRHFYRSRGIPSYKPFVFLMTDGRPTDRENPQTADAFDRLRERQIQSHWTYVPVAIGDEADVDFLAKSSAQGTAYATSKTNFSELFQFLTDSLSDQSRADPANPASIPDSEDYRNLSQMTIDDVPDHGGLGSTGSHSVAERFCINPSCRQRLEPDATFCVHCGTRQR